MSDESSKSRQTTILSVFAALAGSLIGCCLGFLSGFASLILLAELLEQFVIERSGKKHPFSILWLGFWLIAGGFAGGALGSRLSK
jgi:hypothetical protein